MAGPAPTAANTNQSLTTNLEAAIPGAQQALAGNNPAQMQKADAALQNAYKADVAAHPGQQDAIRATKTFQQGDHLSDQLEAAISKVVPQLGVGGSR